MNKRLGAVAAALLALAASGCGASATQTGGGSAPARSTEAAAPTTTSAAAEVKMGTTADAVAAGWLAGNAEPVFPAGGAGKVDVVASAPIKVNSAGLVSLPVTVRNSTSETITSVEVTGAAMDATGKILASGRSQGFSPAVVPAGGVSLGYVFFSAKLPTTAKLEFTVASKPLEGDPYFQDLQVNQANAVGTSVTGKATNTSKNKLNGPYGVHVTCFDAKGSLLGSQIGFASPDADLAAGQSVTFQVDFYDEPCPTFLVGVSGYGPL
ncbi:MAG: hypothetical protein JWQ75_3540 [Pseudarthrobacter sp.]|nr:hypothetical protein [Pseudarthrobacter sp.]